MCVMKAGKIQREIVNTVKVSKTCVQQTIKLYYEFWTVSDWPRAGCQRKTFQQTNRKVASALKKQQKLQLAIRELKASCNNINVPEHIVGHRLNEAGLAYILISKM